MPLAAAAAVAVAAEAEAETGDEAGLPAIFRRMICVFSRKLQLQLQSVDC